MHFKSLLERETLSCSEIKVFMAVNRWAQRKGEESGRDPNEGQNKREVLGESILDLVRFPEIPQKEFAQIVLPANMLTLQFNQSTRSEILVGFQKHRSSRVLQFVY